MTLKQFSYETFFQRSFAVILPFFNFISTLKQHRCAHWEGAPPLIFANTLKSPLNWLKFTKKNLGASPNNPGCPPFFRSILDPPLHVLFRYSGLLIRYNDLPFRYLTVY